MTMTKRQRDRRVRKLRASSIIVFTTMLVLFLFMGFAALSWRTG